MCERDEHLWRCSVPLICFYAVEWHLPQWVAKQFGRRQRTPPDAQSTSVQLHRFVNDFDTFFPVSDIVKVSNLFIAGWIAKGVGKRRNGTLNIENGLPYGTKGRVLSRGMGQWRVRLFT